VEGSTATDVEILHPEGNTKTVTGFRHEAARHPDATLVIGSGLGPHPESSIRTTAALHHKIIVAMAMTSAHAIGSENSHLGDSTEIVAGLRLEAAVTTTTTAALRLGSGLDPRVENPHLGGSTETVAGLRLEATTTTTMTAALPIEAIITTIMTGALHTLHSRAALATTAAL
jgi:hypothetical protein